MCPSGCLSRVSRNVIAHELSPIHLLKVIHVVVVSSMSQQNTYIHTPRVGDEREIGRAALYVFSRTAGVSAAALLRSKAKNARLGSEQNQLPYAPPQMLRRRCSVPTLFCVLLLMIRDQRLDLPFDRRGVLFSFSFLALGRFSSFSFSHFPPEDCN